MSTFTVAVIQARPESASIEEMRRGGDVGHALDLLRKAASHGVDLACFPEMYPLAGEAEVKAAAADLGIWVVAGLEEPAGSGSSAYNTATFIDRTGGIVHRQRKVYPTERERERGIVSGQGYEVVETELGRLGALICSDLAFVGDGVRSLVRQGVEVIVSPSWWFALAEGLPAAVLGRHLEFGVPIVAVNVAKFAMDAPDSNKRADQLPAAGGYSTFTCPPPVGSLEQLTEWFANKPLGINSVADIALSCGAEEEILLGMIDVDAVRNFPGYFYSNAARATLLEDLNR